MLTVLKHFVFLLIILKYDKNFDAFFSVINVISFPFQQFTVMN